MVQVLVTDLDNTLWDWMRIWSASMRALFESLSRESGVPVQLLIDEAKSIHECRGTVEYSLLIDELPSLRGPARASERYALSLDAQHAARKAATVLYPNVESTLRTVKKAGVVVVAYSESLEFWTERRVKRTGLDGVIDVLYTSQDHSVPEGFSFADVRTLPPDDYGLRTTKHRLVAPGLHKPDPEVLLNIVRESGTGPDKVAYVGDSRTKDVAMAQAAGVHDVWAAYGANPDPADVALLESLTHWTEAMVRRETAARAEPPIPSFTLREGFGDLLGLFRFEGHAQG